MPQFNRTSQKPEQCNEHRDLYNHGQAPAHRVDLVGLIEPHHLPIHHLFVVFVFFSDLGQARLELLHLFHGLVALVRQRPKEDLHEDREQDDRKTIVVDILIEKSEEVEEGLGDDIGPAEVDHPVEVAACLLEASEIPRTQIEAVFRRGRLARSDRHRGWNVDALQPSVRQHFSLNPPLRQRLGGQQGPHEIIVFISQPVDMAIELFLLGRILQLHLFEASVLIQDQPDIAVVSLLFLRRNGRQPRFERAGHRSGALVPDLAFDIDGIRSSAEPVNLPVDQALWRAALEDHLLGPSPLGQRQAVNAHFEGQVPIHGEDWISELDPRKISRTRHVAQQLDPWRLGGVCLAVPLQLEALEGGAHIGHHRAIQGGFDHNLLLRDLPAWVCGRLGPGRRRNGLGNRRIDRLRFRRGRQSTFGRRFTLRRSFLLLRSKEKRPPDQHNEG
ncbi:hypothetical protein TRIP_B40151 [uncultured Desulfatiglans sp.]|uniref:Uncharacterized protein n=1 Tax=Uncultured Desulfatiglans sp. TaxID=1748965 RepID=A0A653ADU0_UNCDX|nr:hypothetical protein TRIP_B40151 [uncultured Desulfatiglans sp.]